MRVCEGFRGLTRGLQFRIGPSKGFCGVKGLVRSLGKSVSSRVVSGIVISGAINRRKSTCVCYDMHIH